MGEFTAKHANKLVVDRLATDVKASDFLVSTILSEFDRVHDEFVGPMPYGKSVAKINKVSQEGDTLTVDYSGNVTDVQRKNVGKWMEASLD